MPPLLAFDDITLLPLRMPPIYRRCAALLPRCHRLLPPLLLIGARCDARDERALWHYYC